MTTQPRTRTASRVKKEERESQGQPRRFSVVLCTYNRRNFVLATLASLRRQSIPPGAFEVIVVDNGSKDGTVQAIQSYLKSDKSSARSPEEDWQVQCLVEPKNGLAYARNAG